MSIWRCKNCGEMSFYDDVDSADGYCHRHPAGVGTHHFELVHRTQTAYEIVLTLRDQLGKKLCLTASGRLKVGVKVEEFIAPKQLMELAIELAQDLQTIHQVASSGAPLGELPDATFDAICEIAGTRA